MAKKTTKTWQGPGAGSLAGNWSTAANWSEGSLPVAGDNVVFPAPGGNAHYLVAFDITGRIAFGSVTLHNGSTLAVGANTLLITGGTAATDSLSIASDAAVTIETGGSISAGGVTIDGTLTGAGSVTIQPTAGTTTHSINGTGVVTATDGTLVLAGDVAAASGLRFNIANSKESVLKLEGAIGSGNTFTFAGKHGALELADVTIAPGGLHFSGTVSNLDVVTGTASPGLGTTNYINVQATITQAVLTDSTHIELFGDLNGVSTDLGTITLGSATTATHVDWFADAHHAGHTIGSGTDIVLSDTVCFVAGSHILTPSGDRAVESLVAGDLVLTGSGDDLSAQPVKWIGRRRIDLTAHPRPAVVAPVRIQRGAFAGDMPHSDLLVSPDHAIFVDGMLICVRRLINGTTIYQEQGWSSVEYLHVELDTHAILFAEGLPTESYLDTGNRGFFANAGNPLVLHPDLTDDAQRPTREAASCLPFVWDDAAIKPVWQRLAERAAALGQPVPSRQMTTDADLHLVVNGRTLQPLSGDNGRFIFALPPGATQARLVSRTCAPTEVQPWLEDRRSLGLYVQRMLLRNGNEVQDIAIDDPALSDGWWAVEHDARGLRRWTTGNAVLPLHRLPGAAVLEVRVEGIRQYPLIARGRAVA